MQRDLNRLWRWPWFPTRWQTIWIAAFAIVASIAALAACTAGTVTVVQEPPAPTASAVLRSPPAAEAVPATATPAPTATAVPISLAGRLATPTPDPTATPTATATPLPDPTPDGIGRTVRVPILMYHYLSTPPADADIYRVDLSVPPDLFAAHLDRMLAEGYTAISLYDLLGFLAQGLPLPAKPVVITFDDGYRDNYINAFPLLQARNLEATFFVVTDFIDEQRPEYLSWDMAREMLAAGMSIESHGRNHVSLRGQDVDYLVWQGLGSLETLQHELGVRPRFVSYPAGEYDRTTIDVFKSAHYWAGLTTVQGMTQSSARPFEWERIRVRNTTTPDKLIQLMEADW
jgi:peptidoglycan/xylan/chitin deacetylase (PgdA/CDA1 family)